MQETLFLRLKSASGDLWRTAQDHPFVSALASGDLDRAKFIHYLRQDYAYLIGYSRAIALATAKTDGLTRMTEFSGLLNETLATEMQLHRDFCAKFDISPEELEAVEASPICRGYIDFCIATAATGTSLELLCALIPCGVGYGEIGLRLLPRMNPGHPFRQWVYTYGGDNYQEYAKWMVDALNELGQDAPPSRFGRLLELFKLGCRYEWLFWEMAWKEDGWPV